MTAPIPSLPPRRLGRLMRPDCSIHYEVMGQGPALIFATFDNLRRVGYRRMTASWILEDNTAMHAPFKLVGLTPTRVWKVYRKRLT